MSNLTCPKCNSSHGLSSLKDELNEDKYLCKTCNNVIVVSESGAPEITEEQYLTEG